MSHQAKGRSQPSAAQVSWVTDERPALGGGVQPALAAEVERLRPLPSTAGMIPALQASRRASPAEMRAPVSRRADARPSSRCWWSTCTSTPAPTRVKPPALPSGLVGRCSSSSVNPSPIRSVQDRFCAAVLTSRVSSVRPGHRASAGEPLRRGQLLERGRAAGGRAARGSRTSPTKVPSPLSPSVSQVSVSARPLLGLQQGASCWSASLRAAPPRPGRLRGRGVQHPPRRPGGAVGRPCPAPP